MTGQNFALELMSKLPQSSTLIKGADNPKKVGLIQFQELLSNTLSKVSDNRSFDNNSSILSYSGVNSNDSRKVSNKQTFENQLLRSHRKVDEEEASTEKHEVRTNKAVKKDDDVSEPIKKTEQRKKTNEVNKDEMLKKEETLIDVLSQAFGMQPQDLMKLLASINVKPEDLAGSSANLELYVDKLSSALNLSSEQKQVMTELFQAVKSSVEESFKNANVIQNLMDDEAKSVRDLILPKEGTKEMVKLDETNITVVNYDQGKLDEIMAEFKSKLQTLGQKPQQVSQQDSQQVSQNATNELDQEDVQLLKQGQRKEVPDAENTSPIVKKNGQVEKITEAPVQAGAKNENQDNKSNFNGQSNANSEGEAYAGPGDIKTLVGLTSEKTLTASKDPDVQFNGIPTGQVQKSTDASAIDVVKSQKEVPVSKNEILSQVIEKAKVTLGGDKSEMVIDLKPDNLGKLALKVVTERGIITAKFVAENQQVKETLQANMQLLKDTLEKQGIAVQGFSVSVKQDSKKGFSNHESQSELKSSAVTLNSNGISVAGVVDELDKHTNGNPYSWAGSQFNFTA